MMISRKGSAVAHVGMVRTVGGNVGRVLEEACRWHRSNWKSMAPMHHRAAACTDATGHPRRGHHRTSSYTSCNARSPDRCRPHSRVRRPDTTSLGPRSRLPCLPSTRHTSCRHSTRVGQLVGEVVSPLLGSSSSQWIGE